MKKFLPEKTPKALQNTRTEEIMVSHFYNFLKGEYL